jgi:hypothetical protein
VIVFAHAGHWLVQLAYLVPIGALVIAMVVGKVRERRERLPEREGSQEGDSRSASGQVRQLDD